MVGPSDRGVGNVSKEDGEMKKDGKMAKIVANVKDAFKINRTIPRACEDIFNACRRVRVVVLGSRGSGKTVFLTALASNLINHRMDNGFRLKGWEANLENGYLKTRRDDLPEFPYWEYRKEFARGNWPRKTGTKIGNEEKCNDPMSVLRLPIDFRKQDKSKFVLLEFLDLPGERIADLTMVKRTYQAWCEWMRNQFVGQSEDEGDYASYLENARSCKTKPDLFAAYKEYLLKSYKKLSNWVTPSVVKLTRDGRSTNFLDEIQNRPLGLDENSQFVPIPSEWFDESSDRKAWVKEFTKAYNSYKEVLVAPISNWLKDVDQLVYLVDVVNILASGPEAHSVEQKFGADVLSLFAEKKSHMLGGSIKDYLAKLFMHRLSNVFLVATKSDVAQSDDRDNLRKLAKALLGKELRSVKKDITDCNFMSCASVETVKLTKDKKGHEFLKARVRTDSGQIETISYPLVRIPKEWPSIDEWEEALKEGKYAHYDTFPFFDKRSNVAPPHKGLDSLLTEVLSDILN